MVTQPHVIVQTVRQKAAALSPDAPRQHTYVTTDGSTITRGFANEAMATQFFASQPNIVEVTR